MDIIIILIGGESHVGKTLLAQGLLEKYKIPYTSLDHIKMGLIKGYDDCGFIASDSDDIISEKMWNVVKGIIEKRKYPEERTQEDFILANDTLKEKCMKANLPYFEVRSDYNNEIQLVYNFIHHKLGNC